jgi:hypothetical protein
MSNEKRELNEKARQNLMCNAQQEFNGRKVQKFQYAIIDLNKPGQRYWTANKITSDQIDAFLSEGYSLLKIQRISSGTDTRYNIMAA